MRGERRPRRASWYRRCATARPTTASTPAPRHENLLAAGAIDPTATHAALENAASIASMLPTTECVISEEPEEKAPAMPHGGMGGGMDMM